MKRIFLSTLALLFIAFAVAPIAIAQEDEEATRKQLQEICQPNIYFTENQNGATVNLLTKEVEDFGNFVTIHFRNQGSASDLLQQAIERFRLHTKRLRALPPRIPPEYPQAQVACEKLIADQLFASKQIFKMHVLANAAAKRSTILVDKYKEINRKLGDLHPKVAQLYGYFLTFSKKLSCYAAQCN